MKLNFILLVISVVVWSTSYSQDLANSKQLNTIMQRMTPIGADIDGSPYYNDDWEKGQIISSSGNMFEVVSMKFNVHLKNFVFLRDKQIYTLPKSYNIDAFKIGSASFISASFKGGNKDFFQVLSKGNLKLLKRFQCGLIKGEEAQGVIPATKSKYDMKSDYYIQVNDAPATKLKAKKDKVLEVVKDKADEIEKYIKSNKLKLKNEKDLVKVFEFYNDSK